MQLSIYVEIAKKKQHWNQSLIINNLISFLKNISATDIIVHDDSFSYSSCSENRPMFLSCHTKLFRPLHRTRITGYEKSTGY